MRRTSRPPWIIGGPVVLLITGGLGVFLVLKDEARTPTAATSGRPSSGTSEPPDSAAPSEPEREPTETAEDGTEGTDANGNPLTFTGSPETAGAFLDLMTAQDYESAYALLTEDLRSRYPDDLDFADEFLAEVGASAITSWEMSAAYAGDDHDEISFALDTDAGTSNVTMGVTEEAGELKVCLFVAPDGVIIDETLFECSSEIGLARRT